MSPFKRDAAASVGHEAIRHIIEARRVRTAASVASLDANAGIREHDDQGRFDARRFAPLVVLQVKRRTGQNFDAALQHTPGAADVGLVLIEASRGRVSAHADVDAVVIAAPIRIIQQDEIDVRPAAALAAGMGGEARGDVVRGGQSTRAVASGHVPHSQQIFQLPRIRSHVPD
jgi:hypothetical protein